MYKKIRNSKIENGDKLAIDMGILDYEGSTAFGFSVGVGKMNITVN